MYACTHGVVFAQLIIDGRSHGVFGFFMQFRDEEGSLSSYIAVVYACHLYFCICRRSCNLAIACSVFPCSSGTKKVHRRHISPSFMLVVYSFVFVVGRVFSPLRVRFLHAVPGRRRFIVVIYRRRLCSSFILLYLSYIAVFYSRRVFSPLRVRFFHAVPGRRKCIVVFCHRRLSSSCVLVVHRRRFSRHIFSSFLFVI
jgi:hypothetical protein